MEHLKVIDGNEHTVLMTQVENEIGMIPSARDHSEQASRLFAAAVPGELMEYLASHAETLAPELAGTWRAAGAKRAGTWTEVFGDGAAAEEIFMAWHFARFTQHVAAAGKAAYRLPMYVNAALIRPGYQPGQYPSAGPLPHLLDVWRAGAPAVDFIAPDIYFPNFVEWSRRYVRGANPLFIPEALRSPEAAVNSLYAFAALDAIGFSPVCHRVDRPSRESRCWRRATMSWPSSRRSSSSTRAAARWRASCRSIPTIGSRSSSRSTGMS